MEPQQLKPKAPLKTRIAPTPSGYLHLGNVLSFAITWALARKQNGTIALRIDDLDRARFRPEYLQDIFDTLHFMGINYDEGPQDAEDFLLNYSQHLRLPMYQEVLEQLVAKNLVYACPCSRSQVSAISPEGLYPLTCRTSQLPLTMPDAAWRICIPENTVVYFNDLLLSDQHIHLSAQMPDFVVRRKDCIPAYQIASLCDDLLMGVTMIVRGEDLLTSTAAQLFLANEIGAASFSNIKFLHHPILLEATGNKLSKSHGARSVLEMRKKGLETQDLWHMLAQVLGWQNQDISNAQSFLDNFSLENLPSQLQQVTVCLPAAQKVLI